MDVVVTALLALFVAALVGGLALLAQWARKNRVAEITLVVTLLFSSVLVAGLVAVVAYTTYAGLTAQGEAPEGGGVLVASVAVSAVAGIAGLALCVPPLRRITSRRSQRRASEASATFEAAPEPPEDRPQEPGGRWADPPVFYALWLTVMLLAYNAINLLSFSQLAAAGMFQDTGTATPGLILVSALPFILVAVCGVGFPVRRGYRQTVSRLGYGRVSLRQLAVVPIFVAAALGLAFAAEWIFAALQPGLAENVNKISEGLFSTQGMSLASAILFGLLIGVGAAAGEETLFRGAIQPALGITLTSLLFASIQTQYGPSVVLVQVFLISVGLGLMRRYANTTLAFVTHATYNFTLIMLSYFFGI